MTSSGPPPLPALIAAVGVLVAGLAAAAVHDDAQQARSGPVTSTAPPSTASSTSTTSTSVASSTTSTATSVATTVRPPVTSPEAAANGLWAAYSANNQVAAQRFATDDVIRVLFESQYDGEQGTFQGCRPNGDRFDCLYVQPSAHYAMTVTRDANNGFRVAELTVSPT